MSLTRELARRTRRPVDARARGHALRFLIDTVAVAIGGATTPEGGIVRSWTNGRSNSPEETAFAWGALAHAFELDDLHRASVTHPGCVVIPAALAMTRRHDAPPSALLDGIVRGYEACLRVGESVGPAHYRMFQNTATCGPFGAAAAASSILGLDEDQLVWAFGHAGSVAGGLWQFNLEGALTKPLHAGHAARSGVTAARLAALGLSGAERILEGPKGFHAALCPDPRPASLLAESEESWKIGETSIKPWGSCRHTHPAIDAALRLAERVRGSRWAAIEVRGYPVMGELCDRPDPETPAQARFSIQHTVAVALVRGLVAIDAFEPGAIADPAIARARSLVRFEGAEPFASAYPARWSSEVCVRTDDGGQHVATASSAKGDPETPLDDAELDAKACDLIRHGLGCDEVSARVLVQSLRALAKSDDRAALTPLWNLMDAVLAPSG